MAKRCQKRVTRNERSNTEAGVLYRAGEGYETNLLRDDEART